MTDRSIIIKDYNSYFFRLIFKKIITKVLKGGEKNKRRILLLNVFKQLKNNSGLSDRNIVQLYFKILNNILVRFKIKVRKKGKVSEEIPVPIISTDQMYSMTIHLLIGILRNQKGRSFDNLLSSEILDILKNQGLCKKRIILLNKVIIKNRKYVN
jgi:ribosomal protein S7